MSDYFHGSHYYDIFILLWNIQFPTKTLDDINLQQSGAI